MRPFMKNSGFQFTKKCFFKINNDIAYCVEFEMLSGIIYVYFYVLPMYVPAENRYYTYGIRITELNRNGIEPLLRDAEDNKVEQWCNKLKECLTYDILPAFEEITTPSVLLNQLEKRSFLGSKKYVCPTVWLYRLRFFTEIYARNCPEILKVGNAYSQKLSQAGFLTEGAKDIYYQEICMFTQAANKSMDEVDRLCECMIEQVKSKCFH